ncbi:MAG: TetR/AcrR family transcriptional regulator [Thermoleophilia bacterium]
MSGPERRQALLDAGRRLFARQGFYGVSVGDIAAEAGCSEAILYRHFASKQALLAAVNARMAMRFRDALARAAADAGDDPFAGVVRQLAASVDDPHMPEALRLRSLTVTMVHDPEVKAVIDGVATRFKDVITEAARASQANGHLRDDIPAEEAMRLLGGVSFLAAFECAHHGDEAVARMVGTAQALLTLLRPAAPRKEGT